MCCQDSIYSSTTNPSYMPSNSNQMNALSNSLVAGSGFLTDRLNFTDKVIKIFIIYESSIFKLYFRLSLNHPANSSPFTFNNRRSTPNILSPFNTLSPMTAVG